MVKKVKDKFYVTTPIYYASGKPHLGHAYTSIACDVIARWNRNIGKDVFFSTGTDEHGQKVEKKAFEAGKSPKEFVDDLLPYFKELLEKLDISYDYFVRTTDESHKKFVQKMLQKSFDNGDIYKGVYEGLYCVDCEQYYKADELEEGDVCTIHKKKVESVKDENYFFRLSAYGDKLLKFYKKNPVFLAPASRAAETINFVKEGLEDISVSRSKEKLSWGIEIPFDKGHVSYVWFDALFNYVSLLDTNKKMEFWPANLHMVGKDIMRFHQVFWPAFLMSIGLDLPKRVFAHGYWTADGVKMGKALGNVIDPIEISDKYGVDEFRFYVISAGSFGEDQNFTYELFANRINNDLNNDLGNLVSRVHGMTTKYFDGALPKAGKLEDVDKEFIAKLDIYDEFDSLMQELSYNKAIEVLWSAIREANAYVNNVAPWKEQDKVRLGTTMNVLCSAVVLFAKFVDCFMPSKSMRIFAQYNASKDSSFKFELLKAGHKLGEKDNLFSKIVLEKKMDENESQQSSVAKEGFESLNLKVGKVVKAEKVENSEKLYRLQVDLGSEKRQILSGLQQIYKLEDLKDRKVVVIANLKAAKLAGEESCGMVLAVEDPKLGHDDCGLLVPDLEVGVNLSLEDGRVANNDSIINSKKFSKVEMSVKKGKLYFDGKVVLGVSSDKGFDGKVC